MLRRKIEELLNNWKKSKYGLLIDGPRQVGKTYSIRKFLKEEFSDYLEINLLENKKALEVLKESVNAEDFLLRLSASSEKPLTEGMAIFIDEVQEFKDFDIITLSKFLVEGGKYRFVFSGSLLGVESYGIDSWPMGYMIIEKMFPLDFEEFLWANGISVESIALLKESFDTLQPVPDYLHEKILNLFRVYLLVGGMPDAVNTFTETKDFNQVALAHKVIEAFHKKDVAKYALEEDKALIKTMYDLIPSELNSQSKRFNLKDIPNLKRNENLGLSFGWFSKSGIAIPVYNVEEPFIPLELASRHRLVKLFYSDVGLLTYLMMNPDIKISVLQGKTDIHFGAIYENMVAQMLLASGHEHLYYYSKRGIGEIDFLLEQANEIIPIEVKSGKDYTFHSALDNLLNTQPFNKDIKRAYVLNNDNIQVKGKVTYLPIYLALFL